MNTARDMNIVAHQDFHHVLAIALDGKVKDTRHRGPDLGVDEWLDLGIGSRTWHLAIERKAATGGAFRKLHARQQRLRVRRPDVIPVLAVPRLSKRERQALREHRVNHMDLAGNVWIHSSGLVVRTDGARPTVTRRPPKGRNPFSKKASLVSRVLLAHPFTAWRVRDLAKEASLSVGYSSEVLQSLIDREHAAETPDGFRLNNPVTLLIDWSKVYRWEDNQIHSFVAPQGKQERAEKASAILRAQRVECLLTLLSAADRFIEYVQHDQVHLYVSDVTLATQEALRSHLYAEPVRTGGNLHVMRPYYGKAIAYGAEDVGGIRSVSDVQLFLDLLHYPLRGPEAAAAILKRRLGPRLKLSAKQIATLRGELGL